MMDPYRELLEATISHLKDLQGRGVRFVPVSAEMVASLGAGGSARPKPAAADASPPQARSVASAPAAFIGSDPKPADPAPQSTPTTPTAEDSARKRAALEALRQRVLACVKCPNLVAARKNVVFGVGNPDAEVMFVGEAPGADEDQQGEPFVGAAGQLLTKIIQAMGLSRDTVYIANILKCRPDTPGQKSGNRKPSPEEMQTCIPYLQEQIDLIRPKVVVALGATAVEGLLGKAMGITRLRGNWRVFRGIPLMPTYHPAYLLRNQSLAEKRRVWEDMLQVMEKLAMPISEKQRSFFLRAG